MLLKYYLAYKLTFLCRKLRMFDDENYFKEHVIKYLILD
jgi:hypothetical protein